MCFINDKTQLEKFRALKKPITVWKVGSIDGNTGIAITSYYENVVKWILGTTVVPHRIRRPLRGGEEATAGLYFNISMSEQKNSVLSNRSAHIIALVNPEDIIGVDRNGDTLCCVKAKVTKAPNPCPKIMRIKFLKEYLDVAKCRIASDNALIDALQSEQEDKQEAMEVIVTELNTLRKRSI